MADDDDYRRVKSADRVLQVLETIARGRRMHTAAELAADLRIPKSSLTALLTTMHRRGWLEIDPSGTRYGLGLRALEVGEAYIDNDGSRRNAQFFLDELATATGESVHHGRRDGAFVVYLDGRESRHDIRLHSEIGRRMPAHATAAGKALLARLDDAEVDRVLTWPLPALTPYTITDPDRLHAELAEIRARGFAVEREEHVLGGCGVAAAFGRQSTDSLSLEAPAQRMSADTEAKYGALLMETIDRAWRSVTP